MSLPPVELLVRPHADDGSRYMAVRSDGSTLIQHVPQLWLHLLPYMIASALLDQDYNVDRVLIVRLQNADYDMMHAPLGAVCATPLVDYQHPVRRAAYQYQPERKRAA